MLALEKKNLMCGGLAMRKIVSALALTAILVASTTAYADTIYLKNGSIIKGKVSSFADDQFTVMLNTGSASRATIYYGDISRIEFDSTGMAATDPGPRDTPIRDTPVAGTGRQPPVTDQPPPRDDRAADVPPRSGGSSSTSDGGSPPPDTPRQVAVPPDSGSSDSTPPVTTPRKGTGKTTTVDVIAKRDWTSTGMIVRRGDRIRISASGTVTLDPATGQTSGPEGIDQADAKKLMPDKPTGSLIAVIGADNDDFIFIGGVAEFTAARDGLLFLSVNEGNLSDNSGSYKAAIEVQSQRASR
jgi:sRNA-binding regulator protein Hfq